MKPSTGPLIGKAIVRIPNDYPHVFVKREAIEEPSITLPSREPIRKTRPTTITRPPIIKTRPTTITRPPIIQTEQVAEMIPMIPGNRFMDMFQMAGGIPTSQYLNTTEAPAVAISAPELATTIRALPEGLIKEDRAFEDAWDKVKDYIATGSFGEEYIRDFAEENGLSKKATKELLEYEVVEVDVIEKNNQSIVYIDGTLYLNPWLPPYYDQWLYDIDYEDSDEQENLRDNHFREIYDTIVERGTPTIKKFLRDVYDIDVTSDEPYRLKLVKQYGALLQQKNRKLDGYTQFSSKTLQHLIEELSKESDVDRGNETERLALVKQYGALLKQKGRKHKNYTKASVDTLQRYIAKLA